jgi:uncharacterized protein YjlB
MVSALPIAGGARAGRLIAPKPGKRVAPPAAVGHVRGALEEVDVAVFGAGPAGLSTALAISKACPELKVWCSSML